MSVILDAAQKAYSDWRRDQPDAPALVARVLLKSGADLLFVGFLLGPDLGHGIRMVGGEDAFFPVTLLDPTEVAGIEFQAVEPEPEPPPFGLAAGRK